MFQVLKNVLNTPIITAVSNQLAGPTSATSPKSDIPAPQKKETASERLLRTLEESQPSPSLSRRKDTDEESSDFAKKANKRKSRLGTTKYLAPKQEISDADKELVFKDGYLYWLSPSKRPVGGRNVDGGEKLYVKLQNGLLHMFEDEKAFYYNSAPLFHISISNAFVFLNENAKQLRLSLVEDDEVHFLRHEDNEQLKIWMEFMKEVSARWGAVQKTDLEHEIAGMRRQLGQLWEMCNDGTTPPKIQKRINDLTLEIQLKDSLMADVVARQDELNVVQMQIKKVGRKLELFPEDEPPASDILEPEPEEEESTDSDMEEDEDSIPSKTNSVANELAVNPVVPQFSAALEESQQTSTVNPVPIENIASVEVPPKPKEESSVPIPLAPVLKPDAPQIPVERPVMPAKVAKSTSIKNMAAVEAPPKPKEVTPAPIPVAPELKTAATQPRVEAMPAKVVKSASIKNMAAVISPLISKVESSADIPVVPVLKDTHQPPVEKPAVPAYVAKSASIKNMAAVIAPLISKEVSPVDIPVAPELKQDTPQPPVERPVMPQKVAKSASFKNMAAVEAPPNTKEESPVDIPVAPMLKTDAPPPPVERPAVPAYVAKSASIKNMAAIIAPLISKEVSPVDIPVAPELKQDTPQPPIEKPVVNTKVAKAVSIENMAVVEVVSKSIADSPVGVGNTPSPKEQLNSTPKIESTLLPSVEKLIVPAMVTKSASIENMATDNNSELPSGIPKVKDDSSKLLGPVDSDALASRERSSSNPSSQRKIALKIAPSLKSPLRDNGLLTSIPSASQQSALDKIFIKSGSSESLVNNTATKSEKVAFKTDSGSGRNSKDSLVIDQTSSLVGKIGDNSEVNDSYQKIETSNSSQGSKKGLSLKIAHSAVNSIASPEALRSAAPQSASILPKDLSFKGKTFSPYSEELTESRDAAKGGDEYKKIAKDIPTEPKKKISIAPSLKSSPSMNRPIDDSTLPESDSNESAISVTSISQKKKSIVFATAPTLKPAGSAESGKAPIENGDESSTPTLIKKKLSIAPSLKFAPAPNRSQEELAPVIDAESSSVTTQEPTIQKKKSFMISRAPSLRNALDQESDDDNSKRLSYKVAPKIPDGSAPSLNDEEIRPVSMIKKKLSIAPSLKLAPALNPSLNPSQEDMAPVAPDSSDTTPEPKIQKKKSIMLTRAPSLHSGNIVDQEANDDNITRSSNQGAPKMPDASEQSQDDQQSRPISLMKKKLSIAPSLKSAPALNSSQDDTTSVAAPESSSATTSGTPTQKKKSFMISRAPSLRSAVDQADDDNSKRSSYKVAPKIPDSSAPSLNEEEPRPVSIIKMKQPVPAPLDETTPIESPSLTKKKSIIIKVAPKLPS